MGLMLGMDLDSADRAKAVVSQLLEGGILINRTQDTVLRFLPPYIIQTNSCGPGYPGARLGPDFQRTQKADQQHEADKKEPIKVSSQPQATQVVPPPATTTFPGRDLISIRDLSPIEVETIFHLAGLLKARPANFRTALAGKQMVMFFEKQSLRTRLTFEAGMASMGGNAFFMDQTAGRLDAREKLSDIAHNVERWIDAIVLRTYAHSTVEGMAEHACVPVINALSDLEHPCQALADYFTLMERFGDLRKICLAYVGDGNNVAHSLLLLAAIWVPRFASQRPRDTRQTRRSLPMPKILPDRRVRSLRSSTTQTRLWTGLTRSILMPGPAWVTSMRSRNEIRYSRPIR